MSGLRTRRVVLALAFGLGLSGCDTLLGPEEPASIEIRTDQTEVEVPGDSIRLRAVVRSEEGDKIGGASVSWESRSPDVVSVDSRGVVRGLRNGMAWVVAQSGSVSDSVEITVETPIACAPVGELVLPDTLDGAMTEDDCRLEGTRGDFWSLSLDRTTEVTIELKSSELDAVLVLFDATGSAIAVDDDGGIGLNARIHEFLPAGTYYVYATSFYAAGTGPYRISAFEGGYPSPCPATAALALPDTVTGQVGVNDCVYQNFFVDVWRIRIPSDTTLVLHLVSEELTPFVALTDTLGEILEGRAIGPGSDAWIEVPVRAGSYDVWITDAASARTAGSYSLAARMGASVVTCPAEGAIQLGITVEGELMYGDCYVGYGSADAWSVRLEETTPLRMTMRAPGLRPTILVSDEGGQITHAILGDSARAAGEVSLGAGSYRVWARGGHDLSGSYALNVGIAGRLPPCDPVGSLAPGDTAQGTLSTADCQLPDGQFADPRTVQLDSVRRLTIAVESTEFDAFLIVADSLGQTLHRDDDSGGDRNARLTLTLDPGSYQIWATSYSPASTGAYAVSVVPADSAAPGADRALKPEAPGSTNPPRSLLRSGWTTLPLPPESAMPFPEPEYRKLPKHGLPPVWLRDRL